MLEENLTSVSFFTLFFQVLPMGSSLMYLCWNEYEIETVRAPAGHPTKEKDWEWII